MQNIQTNLFITGIAALEVDFRCWQMTTPTQEILKNRWNYFLGLVNEAQKLGIDKQTVVYENAQKTVLTFSQYMKIEEMATI